MVDLEIEDNPWVLTNVYAPTKDNVDVQNSFWESLKKVLENYSEKPTIIGGGFNTYLNANKIDKNGGKPEQTSSHSSNLIHFMDEYSPVDVWRGQSKQTRLF